MVDNFKKKVLDAVLFLRANRQRTSIRNVQANTGGSLATVHKHLQIVLAENPETP
ncbi:MAG: hypothetical protein LBF82_02060 [Lactobacillales bacterium]|nr:hypothetical protein [Lactobacillales bacterium]